MEEMDKDITNKYGITIFGYKDYQQTLPCSPTTAKKDRNMLQQVREGYIKAKNGSLEQVSF